MITEVEKKIRMETKEQQSVKEAGQQDPAQQRCQGRGGGLEEKAISPVRAAADFTHEKARKGCVSVMLRHRMQRKNPCKSSFFGTLQMRKNKGEVTEFKPQEVESRILNSDEHSRYTFLQLTNTGVENKFNFLCFPTTELSFCLKFPFHLKT